MNFKHFSTTPLIMVFVLAISPSWARASDAADVTATVHRFLDNLDDKTQQIALPICDSPVSILDEFPPYEWHGPNACAEWWDALGAYDDQNGITDGEVALGTPWNVDVNGDRAYFVASMTYTYKQHGKPVKESGAFAVALRRTQAGWRIAAWTYSKQ